MKKRKILKISLFWGRISPEYDPQTVKGLRDGIWDNLARKLSIETWPLK